MTFVYRHRSPFSVLQRIAQGELSSIDRFLELTKRGEESSRKALEKLAAEWGASGDWLVDDFASLDDFAALSAEFAIVGTWRCVELFRKGAIRFAFGEREAAKAYKHYTFQKQLLRLRITEARLRRARSVDELRCLNNAIKHNQTVSGELTSFPRWRSKEGNKLVGLERHHLRLRRAVDGYLKDLTKRLSRSAILKAKPARYGADWGMFSGPPAP
jgi:hypothetical protein